jgi:hypothetical protein
MPAAIDPIIKQRVISQYLQGVSRDKIAADNGIGTGTVSNFIDEHLGNTRYSGGDIVGFVYHNEGNATMAKAITNPGFHLNIL